jgi:hypothetical protein
VIRTYAVGEIETGSSSHPFTFAPSDRDCEGAIDCEALSWKGDRPVTWNFRDAWGGFLLAFLAAGLVVAALVLKLV